MPDRLCFEEAAGGAGRGPGPVLADVRFRAALPPLAGFGGAAVASAAAGWTGRDIASDIRLVTTTSLLFFSSKVSASARASAHDLLAGLQLQLGS